MISSVLAWTFTIYSLDLSLVYGLICIYDYVIVFSLN
jgi:hypothetical protein